MLDYVGELLDQQNRVIVDVGKDIESLIGILVTHTRLSKSMVRHLVYLGVSKFFEDEIMERIQGEVCNGDLEEDTDRGADERSDLAGNDEAPEGSAPGE